MTGDTESVVLEILKRVQNDLTLVRDDLRSLRSEMSSLKQHISGFMMHELNQDSDIVSMKLRLERIERRLDLID